MPKYEWKKSRPNVLSMVTLADVPVLPLAHQLPEDWRSQAAVFEDIFLVFLALGTLVGVVVVAYMLYNAYKYREGATPEAEFDGPTLGELPTGGSGGRKLFLSFAISAIIVIGLVAWTYTALLYVEEGAPEHEDIETDYDIRITGYTFFWEAEYPNGETTTTANPNDEDNYIAVPEGAVVELQVTGADVWHTFGVTDLRVKSDAIPGQTSHSWISVEDPEQDMYRIECFELCGAGHSDMEGTLKIYDHDEWVETYVEEPPEEEEENDDEGDENDNNADAMTVVAP